MATRRLEGNSGAQWRLRWIAHVGTDLGEYGRVDLGCGKPVFQQEIVFEYVPTAYMVADTLTKAVPEEKTSFCRDGMGIL